MITVEPRLTDTPQYNNNIADTCDNNYYMDNSECPDCFSIDFNIIFKPQQGTGPDRACAIVNNLA